MLRKRLTTFKNRLFRINDEEPLSKLSLCVIIALDLFILFAVFSGLDDHTRQLRSPAEYIPYECRAVIIQQSWTQATQMDKLQKLVLSDYRNYSYRYTSPFETSRIQNMHPVCREFFNKIKDIAKDHTILNLFKSRNHLLTEKKQFTDNFKQTKDVYDTSLLEEIADKGGKENQLSSISESMKAKSRQLENLNQRISNIETQLNEQDKIKDLWEYIQTHDAGRRDLLVKDFKRYEFWYPFKVLCWQLLFLLPLFILFYLWNVRSVRKDAKLQILISAHLVVVSAVPIFFKILEVVLDLIPRHFFKKFFEILTALHIVAVWHYIVIIGAIGFALLAIYIIQKKLFNKRRLELKRLTKGQCFHCGKKLPPNADICPFCGTDQHKTCPACTHRTYAAGEYCIECGKQLG